MTRSSIKKSTPRNIPEASLWNRIKDGVQSFRYRHNINVPHPIQWIKNTDPRMTNLFTSSAVVGAGFIVSLSGAAQAIQDQDLVTTCNSSDTVETLGQELCDIVKAEQRSNTNFAIGGGAVALAGIAAGSIIDKNLRSKPITPQRGITR